jgi:transcriptional regulator with XRE-family HTH domain
MSVLTNELQRARRRAERTQTELARASGIAQGDISKIERGMVGATMSTMTRLAEALDYEVALVPALTREDRVTLALHQRIATRLLEDPDRVLGLATDRLRRWRKEQPAHTQPWVATWDGIVRLPPRVIADLIVDRSGFARELRQTSPFVGVLTDAERRTAIKEARSR